MVVAAASADLEWCHAPSDFHSLRLEAIIDRYLSRGAETPVRAVVLEDYVKLSIVGNHGHQIILSRYVCRYFYPRLYVPEYTYWPDVYGTYIRACGLQLGLFTFVLVAT